MGELPQISRQELRNQPVSVVMTRQVYAVPPETPLLKLTTEMRARRISCVVVCQAQQPVGIISERDVVRILCETSKPASALKAADVMSSPVRTISPEMRCPEVMSLMRQQNFRRFPVVNAQGHLLGLVTQTDLLRASERDLAEYTARLEQAIERKTEQLNKLSSLKDDLLSMIVHDLKNPLAVILGILEATVYSRKQLEEGWLRKRLGLALEAARSLLRMVLNLLDINKIESGELKPDRGSVQCQELVQRSMRSISELAERDGQRLEIIRMEKDRTIEADGNLLERVLQNLLSNAIKFSPANGRIEIASWIDLKSPPRALFSVANFGKPIDAEYHEKIFDKFAQIEAKNSGNVASTGLGLSFCKLAVEAHGGRIWVESPIDGSMGARFTFSIPLE